MSIELRIVCCVLATWRITHLLTAEDGPGDVVVRLRASLGPSVLGRAMDCFYCLSVWVAAPLAPFVSTDPLEWAFTWLALSGGACLLERATAPGLAPHPKTRAVREGGLDELLWREAPGDPRSDAAAATAGPSSLGRAGAMDSDHVSR
jgi:hypothetical protein